MNRSGSLHRLWVLVLATATLLAGASTATAGNARAPDVATRQHAPYTRLARPVLAFYYSWYHRDTWCRCHMSDLPVTRYDSSDISTMDRQIAEASRAGITGFISSWPGPGNTQDANLGQLMGRIALYDHTHKVHFVTSAYVESDMDAIRTNLAGAMRYLLRTYADSPSFFHWAGKPVIFVWHPIGNGRTLSTWAALRRQVDPAHRTLWIAEGTDVGLLSVFDGLHLFSAAYWGLQDGSIDSVDQSFRARIDRYNADHRTHGLWAAGVQPGYDDTRVPGRAQPYRVLRNNGATYARSWNGALSSHPDWITISTFNEWFEGSMIEPSPTYGDLYLRLTKRYSAKWRHGR